jgi:Tfp pilus assembly protein PilN
MIQFNLLPDVKLEYVKAQRMKHLVMVVSVIIAGVMIALMSVLFVSTQVQKQHLANLQEDISQKSSQLQNEPDINKILTVQNQIVTLNGVDEAALDGLHEGKPATERIGKFITQLTPNGVKIAELKVDFQSNTISITGAAATIKDVNMYVDTLKFTTFDKDGAETAAFKPVVLSSFERADQDGATDTAKYKIDATFDPGLFNTTQNVKLKIPVNQVTTRSVTERPLPVFEQQNTGGAQ